MLRRFLLFATLYSSACQLTEQLRFTFQRSGYGTGNAITLFCYNDQGIQINLMMNDSVKFFVNRTIPGPDLGRLVELTRSEDGTSVSFIITRELEGQYACGTVDPAPLVTSNYVPLVGKF